MFGYLDQLWKIHRRRRALAALADLPPQLLADATGLERAQLESLLAFRSDAEIVAFLESALGPQALRQIGSVILSTKDSNAASSSAEAACGRGSRNGRLTTIAACGPALAASAANTSPGSRPPLSSR